MEDDKIGKLCQTCNIRAYLPLTCKICNKTFCDEHVREHSCENIKQPPKPKKNPQLNANKCNLCKTKVSQVNQYNCQKCLNKYCLKHRHQDSHSCNSQHVNHPKKTLNEFQQMRKNLQKRKANQQNPKVANYKEEKTIQNASPAKDKVQPLSTGAPTKKILDSYRQTFKSKRLKNNSSTIVSNKQQSIQKPQTYQSPFEQKLLMNNKSKTAQNHLLKAVQEQSKKNQIEVAKQKPQQQKQSLINQNNQSHQVKQVQKNQNQLHIQMDNSSSQKKQEEKKEIVGKQITLLSYQQNQEKHNQVVFQQKSKCTQKQGIKQFTESPLSFEQQQKDKQLISVQKEHINKNTCSVISHQKQESNNRKISKDKSEIQNADGIEKNKKDKKTQKILLKQHLVIKQITKNMHQALRGLQYVHKKVKTNPMAKDRVKEGLSLIASIFKDLS